MDMQIIDYIRTLFWINFWTVIVVSVGFSLLMICLLCINGLMSFNDWLFRSIETKMDPPQKPELLSSSEEEDKMIPSTTVKEAYLKNGQATIPLVREWYNNPYMFSDLTPDMESLFVQLIELWDIAWPTISAQMEKIKNTGITVGAFEIAVKILREDNETKPLIDKLCNTSDQIKAKINGGV